MLFPNDEIININVMNDVASIGGLGNFSNVDLEKVLAGKSGSDPLHFSFGKTFQFLGEIAGSSIY